MLRGLAILTIVAAVVACGAPASPGPLQPSSQAPAAVATTTDPGVPLEPDTAETLCLAVRALQVVDEEHASRLAAILGDWPVVGPDATTPASEKTEALARARAVAEAVQRHQTPLDVLTSPAFPEILSDARMAYSMYMVAVLALEPWLDARSSGNPGYPFDTPVGQLRAAREALGRAIAGIDMAVAAGRMSCPA